MVLVHPVPYITEKFQAFQSFGYCENSHIARAIKHRANMCDACAWVAKYAKYAKIKHIGKHTNVSITTVYSNPSALRPVFILREIYSKSFNGIAYLISLCKICTLWLDGAVNLHCKYQSCVSTDIITVCRVANQYMTLFKCATTMFIVSV